MNYEIKGTPFPVVICKVADGERMITEKGAMVWMSPNMEMQTSGGGLGKMFSKAFSGESMFQNIYTAHGEGMITFGSCFPGRIVPLEIAPGREFILQKSAFLAATEGVELSIHFNKKLGAGFFGGEGFISACPARARHSRKSTASWSSTPSRRVRSSSWTPATSQALNPAFPSTFSRSPASRTSCSAARACSTPR